MPTDAEFAQCKECLCLASRQIAQALTRLYERYLRPHGIHVTQFTALAILREGPVTMGELAKAIGIERTTLSRNLVRLEAQGWVEITNGANDARSRIVALTQKGAAKLGAVLPAWQEAQQAALAVVGNGGVNDLRNLASKASAGPVARGRQAARR
jgi:DNA-binding MarR family transcriptional regulator